MRSVLWRLICRAVAFETILSRRGVISRQIRTEVPIEAASSLLGLRPPARSCAGRLAAQHLSFPCGNEARCPALLMGGWRAAQVSLRITGLDF